MTSAVVEQARGLFIGGSMDGRRIPADLDARFYTNGYEAWEEQLNITCEAPNLIVTRDYALVPRPEASMIG